MPPSPEPRSDSTPPAQPAGIRLAIAAEALYLANLLVIPVIAFLILGVLFLRCDKATPPLAAAHVNQTFSASLWAGILLVVVNASILLLGGYEGIHTWTLVILYFTTCHSALVLFGVVGLAKAMAGQCWRFPLVGRPLP
ncbi:hypothetical protein, partial [Candidatus Thiosymbion oneisti]|uniref:hypothetical protein n=1 Tax=Candidatus Thiosymbion oneisti TaxID=589554 RepID=UPI001C405C13